MDSNFIDLFNTDIFEQLKQENIASRKTIAQLREELTLKVDEIYQLPEQLEYQGYMETARKLPKGSLNAIKGFFIPDDTYAEQVFGDMLHEPDFGLLSALGRPALSGRFVYPVLGFNREVIGLIGYDKHHTIKYLLTKTKGFHKNNTFYGMMQMRFIYREGYIIVFEGIVDPILLWVLGLPAIGLNGNILNPFVIRILKRFDKVIFFPDNNEAGERSLPFWLKEIPYAHVVKMKNGNDFDDRRKEKNLADFLDIINDIKSNWYLPREHLF